MNFNERFKKWILENNIKQIDIANKLGVNKSYISNVISGRVPPSEKIINELVEMSGKNEHWWLFGKEEYDNLDSLNSLLDNLIERELIDKDGNMNETIYNSIQAVLKAEIEHKLEIKYKKNKALD